MTAPSATLPPIRGVLFDLDGTLVDTAPDLAAALNHTRRQSGLEPLPFEVIRPHVSHGTTAMIKSGFNISEDAAHFDELRQLLLDYYLHHIAIHSVLFEGMAMVLESLEQQQISWGVVTNKPAWLTTPLLAALQLDQRAGVVVSGDTLPQRKPDPAPLLHAAQLLGPRCSEIIYVGDAERDIEAGRRAGMRTLVAEYGYLCSGDCTAEWQADGAIQHAAQLLDWISHWNGH